MNVSPVPDSGAMVRVFRVELVALFNILGVVAVSGIAEQGERNMARHLQAQIDPALADPA
jgi:hypothetical protein